MKLIEALEITNKTLSGSPKQYFLACGFEPLHLYSFLRAHLQSRENAPIDLVSGLYGDLPGNIEKATRANGEGVAVVLEWADLDSRLGFRNYASLTVESAADVLQTVHTSLGRIQQALEMLARERRVALCLPTLQIAPYPVSTGSQWSVFETKLSSLLASFAESVAENGTIRIINVDMLDRLSPKSTRRDLKSDLGWGFPYTHEHADAVAKLLADLLCPLPIKKGIITDLDDTFWKGILGEVGVDGVKWDHANRAEAHGIYQAMLQSLADSGIFVAVASKNDPELVAKAFLRNDLRIHADRIFPVCANWKPKSESVAEILKAWNIAEDAVVFVDDSALELAQVKSVNPGIECIQFRADLRHFESFLQEIRGYFGKSKLTKEDSLRSFSIRSAGQWRDASTSSEASYDQFLSQAQSVIDVRSHDEAQRLRCFELVNKTNQFNLNGRRYTEQEWERLLVRNRSELISVSYQDKFGDLGVISSLVGQTENDVLKVDAWVLSCRAFARRIEHATLAQLFERLRVKAIEFDFQQTERNGPLRDFLGEFDVASPDTVLTKEKFEAKCPKLFHKVKQ